MPSDENLDRSSQDRELFVLLIPHAKGAVSVDGVCDQLIAEFPGAVIVAQNSFAAKRLSLEDFRKHAQEQFHQGRLEPWGWQTMDELNSGVDQLFSDNRRTELRSGPKSNLAIPLGDGTQLLGHVGAKSILFRGKCQRSDATVGALARFLESLNIGKVEILDHDPKPNA